MASKKTREMSFKKFIKCLKAFKVKFNPENINDMMLILDMNENKSIDRKELEVYLSDFFKKRGKDFK